jgi:hypothetical protein
VLAQATSVPQAVHPLIGPPLVTVTTSPNMLAYLARLLPEPRLLLLGLLVAPGQVSCQRLTLL